MTVNEGERGRLGAITRVSEDLEAGAAAGLIGGIAMLLLLCTHALATGRNVLEPLQWFGATFYGQGAAAAGFSSAFWGLAIHLAVSTALGVPFTLLLGRGVDPMVATAAGVVYALLAWLAFTFLLLPLVDPVMARAVAQVPIAWFAAHVPYGATLALAKQIRAALEAHERSVQEA